jgi:hypothetical protein
MFSADDVSNAVRYSQLNDLIDDIVPLGKGLGAEVPGNIRDDERPYGFELSYVNLIHKLGIVSLFTIFAYFFSFYKAIAALRNINVDRRYAAVSLGGLCYLFPAIGNPIIAEPQLILMHCICLYLIRPSI